MKQCSRCKQSKALESFNKRGAGYQAACRECNKEYYKEYYQNNPKEKARILAKNRSNKKAIIEYIRQKKDVPCSDCKNRFPYYVMQFDHLRDKLFSIGKDFGRYSLRQVKEEIEKCEVVCANCHAERTHSRNNGEWGNR